MLYDIFLSHSSEDHSLVDKTRLELVQQGYSVFVDSEVLPKISPEEVTHETAETLRNAMKDCTSLLYLISANSGTSRWMPWELGYFDGFSGRVFVYPSDENAAAYAKGREYLRIYPIVPLEGRSEFLTKYVPRSVAEVEPRYQLPLGGLSEVARPLGGGRVGEARAPLFGYAQQEQTALHGKRLLGEIPGALVDPMRTWSIMNEMVQAYWRLWGLMPPPRRPGAEEGKWDR